MVREGGCGGDMEREVGKKKLEFKVDPKTMGVFGCRPYPASEVWRQRTSGDENGHLSFGVFFHWKRLRQPNLNAEANNSHPSVAA